MDTNYQTKTKVFRGITVELETWDENGEPRSSCFLSIETSDGSRYQGSLPLVQFEGGIPYEAGGGDEGEERYIIGPGTMEEIEEWANENGY